MLSRVKASCLAAAAVLVVSGSVMSPTTAAPTQGNTQLAMSVQRDGARGIEMHRSFSRDMRSDRAMARHVDHVDRDRINRTAVHRNIVVHRDINRRHVVIVRDHRRRFFAAVDIVVLGPVVYADYGPNWCRGLHRGYHWAPWIGWHSGRHYGLFRC